MAGTSPSRSPSGLPFPLHPSHKARAQAPGAGARCSRQAPLLPEESNPQLRVQLTRLNYSHLILLME